MLCSAHLHDSCVYWCALSYKLGNDCWKLFVSTHLSPMWHTYETTILLCSAHHTKDTFTGYATAARLAPYMLQCDLLCGNSVYMVGSCRAWFLHINHVSAVSEVSVLQEKYSRQPVPRGNYKFKLRLPPRLAAVVRLLRAACRDVNTPVVILCFYFAVRLSRRSRAACCIPCKRSLSLLLPKWINFNPSMDK